MHFDGLFAHPQLEGDLLVEHARRDEVADFPFPFRESREPFLGIALPIVLPQQVVELVEDDHAQPAAERALAAALERVQLRVRLEEGLLQHVEGLEAAAREARDALLDLDDQALPVALVQRVPGDLVADPRPGEQVLGSPAVVRGIGLR